MSRRRNIPITAENADQLFKRDSTVLIGMLQSYARRWYGERCPVFDKDCACCRTWQTHDTIKELAQ